MRTRDRLILGATVVIAAASPAPAQLSIGPGGVRSGNTVIDSTGVHTAGADVTSGGVRARRAGPGATIIRTNGGTRAIDCGGRSLTVDGNSNHLRVTNCASVTIDGNANDLSAGYAAAGRLSVLGNHNRVSWHAAPGVRVAVTNLGTANTVGRR